MYIEIWFKCFNQCAIWSTPKSEALRGKTESKMAERNDRANEERRTSTFDENEYESKWWCCLLWYVVIPVDQFVYFIEWYRCGRNDQSNEILAILSPTDCECYAKGCSSVLFDIVFLFSDVAMQIVLPVLFLSFLSTDSSAFRSRLPTARCGEEIIILSVFVVKHWRLSLDEPEPSSAEKLCRLDHSPEIVISIRIYICWCCTLVHEESPCPIVFTIAILWSRNKLHLQSIVSSEITTNDLRWNRTEEINGKEDQTSSHLCPLC